MNKENQPVNNIQWIHRDELSPNLYNPNSVAPPEKKLLKVSILSDGWLFPILALSKQNKEQKYTIIDGYHRWSLSQDKDIYELTDGYLPVIVLSPINRMATTVRMNRAKGTHAVLKMADIITEEVKQGRSMQELMETYGMEKEEVIRLTNANGIPQTDIVKNNEWSKSWKPK